MLIILAIQILSVILVFIINTILKKTSKRLNTIIIHEDPTQSRIIYQQNKKKLDRLTTLRNILRDRLTSINHCIILVLALVQIIIQYS